jgi:hypothetical protein
LWLFLLALLLLWLAGERCGVRIALFFLTFKSVSRGVITVGDCSDDNAGDWRLTGVCGLTFILLDEMDGFLRGIGVVYWLLVATGADRCRVCVFRTGTFFFVAVAKVGEDEAIGPIV